MTYFLGIDGGGTKTTCVVGDDTRLLGTAKAGGSNLVRVAEDVACKNLQAAIRDACWNARVSPAQIASACIGVAGITAAGVPGKVKAIVEEIMQGAIQVVGDMDIALEAAFGDGPGVIVIAGTGSIAFGRDQDGKTIRAGGWGYAISDEGSAYWIGRELVRHALHSWDLDDPGTPPTLVRQAWKLQTRDELVRMANACPPPPFAELFPAVVRSAEGGDCEATSILEDAAIELAALAQDAISLRWGDRGNDIPIAVTGGVFSASPTVREKFSTTLEAWGMTAVLPDVVDPVMGALARARKAL